MAAKVAVAARAAVAGKRGLGSGSSSGGKCCCHSPCCPGHCHFFCWCIKSFVRALLPVLHGFAWTAASTFNAAALVSAGGRQFRAKLAVHSGWCFFRASKLGWNTPHDDDILVSDSQALGAMCAGGGNAGTEAGVASASPVMWRRLLPLLLLQLLPLLQLAIVCCCLQAEQLAATAASAPLHQRIPRPGRCSPHQQHHPLPCPAWHCQARDSCPLVRLQICLSAACMIVVLCGSALMVCCLATSQFAWRHRNF